MAQPRVGRVYLTLDPGRASADGDGHGTIERAVPDETIAVTGETRFECSPPVASNYNGATPGAESESFAEEDPGLPILD